MNGPKTYDWKELPAKGDELPMLARRWTPALDEGHVVL